MSFLLKSPRLARSLVGFARQAKFAYKKNKIPPCVNQFHYKVSKTFVRPYSLTPKSYATLANAQNSKETFYQKSVSQVCIDIRYRGYTFREDIDDAWHSLRSTTAFTIEQTVTLIKSCGHSLPQEAPSEKLKLVKEIWDSFDEIGIKKTIYHYEALLDVFNELEHDFCIKNFLSNLKKQGLTPTLETYKKLLHALSIQGNICNAQCLLEHMKINSITIDDGVFNSLILGHSLQGDFISAHGIIDLMKEKGLMLSSESYCNLALGYAKLGDIDQVKEIMKECKEKRMMLTTTELLEIAYTFAVNKHSEHFFRVLDMITLTKNFPTISTKIVHRLLHKNLDKEAFAIFQLRNKLESISKSQEPLQMFLDHYIRFRKPNEVFNMVEIYQQNGWSPIALAYCIKETLLQKDISYCLNFLKALQSQGYPLRGHYFYPILLKTHQSGNEEVLKMLREIKEYNVSFNREAFRAFHRFYDFIPGSELKDLEKIKNAGVREKFIAWKILDVLLFRKNIDDAIKLVSTYKIAYPSVLLPTSMAPAFSAEGADHEKFVYILYYLIHNLRANKIIRRLNLEVNPAEYEQFMIEIAKVCDKTFNLRVMEEMLKKKIPVSHSAGVFISKRFSCPEVNDLLSKLMSADLKLEFDETLIKRLLRDDEHEKKIFSVKDGKTNWSELEEAVENKKNVPIVMSIFEKLAQKGDFEDNFGNILEKLFRYVSHNGDVASTERIYEFGVQNKIFSKDNYAPCVMAYIVRKKFNDAVGRFYEGLKATKKSIGLETLIREIKKSKNHLALSDLKVCMNDVYGEYSGTAELLKIFAKCGYIGEMTKILETKSLKVKSVFNELCREVFRERDVEFLEKVERASRNVPELNFTYVYYQLLNLHAFSGNLGKILNLYIELERDDCNKEHFQKILFYHLKNWRHDVPERLKNVLQCVLEDCAAKKPVKDTETVSYEEDIRDVSTEEIQPSSDTKVKAVPDFINEDLFECYCLIQAGKIDEYFKILKNKIEMVGSEKANKYFFCYKLIPHFKAKPKYIKEYEMLVSLANHNFLWKKYLLLCIRLGYIREAKKVMQKLTSRDLQMCFQQVSANDCLRVVRETNCHVILGEKMAYFYSRVINTCLKENKFEMAKKYLKKAKKNKLGFLLNNFEVV